MIKKVFFPLSYVCISSSSFFFGKFVPVPLYFMYGFTFFSKSVFSFHFALVRFFFKEKSRMIRRRQGQGDLFLGFEDVNPK